MSCLSLSVTFLNAVMDLPEVELTARMARAGYTPEFVQQPALEANELAHMRGEYVYVSDELHEAAIAEAFDIIGGRLQGLAWLV